MRRETRRKIRKIYYMLWNFVYQFFTAIFIVLGFSELYDFYRLSMYSSITNAIVFFVAALFIQFMYHIFELWFFNSLRGKRRLLKDD